MSAAQGSRVQILRENTNILTEQASKQTNRQTETPTDNLATVDESSVSASAFSPVFSSAWHVAVAGMQRPDLTSWASDLVPSQFKGLCCGRLRVRGLGFRG